MWPATLPGPAAATVLADFGADVIKVEPPGTGDAQRYLSNVPPSPRASANYSWHLADRIKRGMALLRQHFPTGTDLSLPGPGILANVAAQLNGRPRETLDWKTPAEALNELLSNPPTVASTA